MASASFAARTALAEFTGTVKEVVVADAIPETMQVLVVAELWSPDGERTTLFASETFASPSHSLGEGSEQSIARSSTIRRFTQGNPQGESQGDIPALLRRVACTIEAMGEIDVQDLILSRDAGADGAEFPSLTVYFNGADEPE